MNADKAGAMTLGFSLNASVAGKEMSWRRLDIVGKGWIVTRKYHGGLHGLLYCNCMASVK